MQSFKDLAAGKPVKTIWSTIFEKHLSDRFHDCPKITIRNSSLPFN